MKVVDVSSPMWRSVGLSQAPLLKTREKRSWQPTPGFNACEQLKLQTGSGVAPSTEHGRSILGRTWHKCWK